MDCNEFRNIVADLFDKEIDPQIKAECEKHISQCAECKEYYEDLLRAAELLRPKHSPVTKNKKKKTDSSLFTLHSSLFKIAASFIGIIMLSGITLAAYHVISPQQTADRAKESEPKMLGAFFVPKDCKNPIVKGRGDAITVKWTKGTWVQHDDDSFIEEHSDGGGYMLHLKYYDIKLNGKGLDIHSLPDLPASALKKLEITSNGERHWQANLITTPVKVPADAKGNVNPELTILLTGTVPKGAYQPVTIWECKGNKDSYDWHDYFYTSWTSKWDNIRRHLKEVVNRKDHHVRINVCKGVPQKHIDRITKIMGEEGVTNYEFVNQK